jgi:hypothetical protein
MRRESTLRGGRREIYDACARKEKGGTYMMLAQRGRRKIYDAYAKRRKAENI